MKTLYVSDLDGTLLNSDALLSDYTIRQINQLIEKGIMFSVATARSRSAIEKTKDLHLSLPMIQLNGVLIYDPQKQTYVDCTALSYQQACAVMQILRDFNRMAFVYKYEDAGEIAVEFECFANEVERDFFEARKNKDYKRFEQVERIEILPTEQVIYFTMVDTYERLKPIFDHMNCLEGVKPTLYSDNYSGLYFLEVFSAKATKAAGVQHLKALSQADKVVVFGDNLNDLDMFAHADFSVAVSNAVDEVCQKADLVIGSNDEDGVAKYLTELII